MNFREPNEDLFEESRMTFGQHLEELRKVLVKSLIGVAACSAIGFIFATQVVEILKQPLTDAMRDYDRVQAESALLESDGYISPELIPWLEKEQFVPRRMRVDPAQLVQAVETVIPGFGDQVTIDSYGFSASDFDIDRLPRLCGELANQSSKDPDQAAQAGYVWGLLTTTEKQAVTKIANNPVADLADLNLVVKIFSRLSSEATLYEAAEFESRVTEDKASFWAMLGEVEDKPLAKMKAKVLETDDPDLARRLNRALLTGTFSAAMPELKMKLVPIEFWEVSDFEPQSLGTSEPFMVWVKAGLLTGLILAGPWVFYQLWSFVAAGLYPHEQKYVHLFLPISIALFVSGVLLAFFFVFQPVLGFLFSFNRQMGIAPQIRINDWLSFVMFLPLGFGIAFQLPLVMLFMNRIGLFQVSDYLAKWRIAVMIIFVMSMILTPADPISMLLLALPLTMLYFLGVAMCQWMPRNQNPFGEPERTYTSADAAE